MNLKLDENLGLPHPPPRIAEPENSSMAIAEIEQFLKIVPAVRNSPQKYLWSSYDAEADVLYINFKKPSHATDTELTDNDIIVRYENDEVIGLTVLHASQR